MNRAESDLYAEGLRRDREAELQHRAERHLTVIKVERALCTACGHERPYAQGAENRVCPGCGGGRLISHPAS